MRVVASIRTREILESRGNFSIEVYVMFVDGSAGRTAVHSGASTGSREAAEPHDGDRRRFSGKGALPAQKALCIAVVPSERLRSSPVFQPGPLG